MTSACPKCNGERVWRLTFKGNGKEQWHRWCKDCENEKGKVAKLKRREYYLTQERQRQHKKRQTPEGRAYGLWNNAKGRAKEKGWEFTIKLEAIEKVLSDGVCQVSGIPFDLSSEGYKQSMPFAPSLDRRDSSKGYTAENVQVVCWIYNMAKQAWGHEDVMVMARALVYGEKL